MRRASVFLIFTMILLGTASADARGGRSDPDDCTADSTDPDCPDSAAAAKPPPPPPAQGATPATAPPPKR